MRPFENEGQVLGALGVLLLVMWATCGGACDGPPRGAPAGTPCTASADCVTGYCVGTCAAAVCVDPRLEVECTPDAPHPGFVPACSCAGETFAAVRPLCVPEPIAHHGVCP